MKDNALRLTMERYILLSILSIISHTSLCSASNPESCETSTYARQSCWERLSPLAQILKVVKPSRVSCGAACSRNIKCQTFHYHENTKQCQLNKERPQSNREPSNRNQIVYFIRSIQNYSQSEDNQPSEKDGGEVKRFFFSRITKATVFELAVHRNDSLTTTYDYVTPRMFLALHYNPELKMLFLAEETPHQLLSFPLNSSRESVLHRHFYQGITVDGDIQLLFAKSKNELHQMTVNGTRFQKALALHRQCYITAMTLDRPRRYIYVVYKDYRTFPISYFSLMTISYAGPVLNNIITNTRERMSFAAYESTTNSLFYVINDKLVMFNVVSKMHTNLTSVGEIGGMDVDQDTLYITNLTTLSMYDYRQNLTRLIGLPATDYTYLFCPMY